MNTACAEANRQLSFEGQCAIIQHVALFVCHQISADPRYILSCWQDIVKIACCSKVLLVVGHLHMFVKPN